MKVIKEFDKTVEEQQIQQQAYQQENPIDVVEKEVRNIS